jgi:uncharacterized membrane protein (DUF2068 family)
MIPIISVSTDQTLPCKGQLVEAYGLWYGKRWAEWFAALRVGLYIPVEVYKLFNSVSLLKIGVLSVNVLVVALMLYALKRPNGHQIKKGKVG